MKPEDLVEALLSENWKSLGDGVEYYISGNEMTVYVPERKFKDVPDNDEFRRIHAETVALDLLNSETFTEQGSWMVTDSTPVSGTIHPNSDAVGWNVYFRDTSKDEPDYTD